MSGRKYVGFIDTLDDDDYGIVVGSDGEIKGVWVPVEYAHQEVPQPIIDFCIKHFGVDISDEDEGLND
jgi:hypothetical protein